MIIFIYGPNTYSSQQKLLSIKKRYIDSSLGDTNLVTLDGKTLTADQFRQQVQAAPFLANSRLVIIRNLLLEGKKEAMEAIGDQLEEIPKTTVVLFFESGQPDKRLKFFTLLSKLKQAQEFPQLNPIELEGQALEIAAAKKLTLAPNQAKQLVNLTGGNLWQLDHELEKLSLYTESTQKSLSDQIITQLVTDNAELNIFHLTDAFGQRQSQKALQLLDRLKDDENLLGTLALIAGQYRNLLLISEGLKQHIPKNELAKMLQLNPYVFDKSYQQSSGYDYEELKVIYRYLFYVDIGSKQSLIEPLTGLTVLAAALAKKPLQLPDLTELVMVQ